MPGGPRGLSVAQQELLRLLEAFPGIGISTAATALRVAPNTVSALVHELVVHRLVARETDRADRRAARLLLTDAGSSVLADRREARQRTVDAALTQLSVAERAAVLNALPALRRLAEVIDQMSR